MRSLVSRRSASNASHRPIWPGIRPAQSGNIAIASFGRGRPRPRPRQARPAAVQSARPTPWLHRTQLPLQQGLRPRKVSRSCRLLLCGNPHQHINHDSSEPPLNRSFISAPDRAQQCNAATAAFVPSEIVRTEGVSPHRIEGRADRPHLALAPVFFDRFFGRRCRCGRCRAGGRRRAAYGIRIRLCIL